jgi:hypothetical protein
MDANKIAMNVDKCKLCLRENQELQASHLIPAAMYERVCESGAKNPNPVILTRKRVVQSSRQITTYLLCRECEQRFSKNGEEWMTGQVLDGKKDFPLLDRLKEGAPFRVGAAYEAYSGTAVGVDTEKLAYFGLSVLWRASVAKWWISSTETTAIDLGEHQEPIRRFLLGETGFPHDVLAIATVCTDFDSQGCFYPPCAVPQNPFRAYSLLTLGVSFRFFMGADVPPEFRAFCCVHSSDRRITVANHRESSHHSFGHLFASAKPSQGLL